MKMDLKNIRTNRNLRLAYSILTGIWAILLLWIFVTVLPAAGSAKGLYWAAAAVIVVLTAAEVWLVSRASRTDLSKGLMIAGWIAAGVLWAFTFVLGLNLDALPIAGTAVESARMFLSFYLVVPMCLPFWWTVRMLMPADGK